MPDDQDYAQLARLLSSPTSWSAAQAAQMRSLLASQRQSVAACHPKDTKRRQSMQAVADEMETALQQYEAAGG